MLDPEYPAAHSMDVSWYAVDGKGNVALFLSGAGGAIPKRAYAPDADEIMDEMDDEDGEEAGVTLSPEQLPAEDQVFVYETGQWDECFCDLYHRSRKPKKALHVDQLPPNLRSALGQVCFDTIDFNKTKTIQPIELTECLTWDPAYLASDGKTVRPVPGRKREYKKHAADLRDEVDGLTYEGLDDKK